ncbi:MAG: cystathionine gamma-synthase family protein [Ignisphaera sp.]|nr:cystathionine gamma-synthase family protein [Ignisphaera sp.]MDW8085584.1 cystathionine gamma-synthase family protein [Ignisphaera sp.]
MAGLSTNAIHGHEHRDGMGSHIPPVYLSVVYEYIDYELKEAVFVDRGNYLRYGREENPTTRALERVVAKLEAVEDALAFNSGMAALSTTFICSLKPGDKIVLPMELYSSTFALLDNIAPKLGVKVEKVWPSAEAIVEAVDGSTSMVFLEVMTNPTNKIIDLDYLSKHLDLSRVALVVDNTFTTPVVLKPSRYRAKLVVHSMTKYFGGHNDAVGGVVAGYKRDTTAIWDWRRVLGGILQPFEAYMILRGVKTLEIRFERHSSNAKAVAEYLANHSRVEEVMYPGLQSSPYHGVAKKLFEKPLFGGVVSFKIRGSYQDVLSFMRRLKVVKRCPSLGGAESMAVIPVKAGAMFIDPEQRARLGISENMVRLSIGLENVEDIIEDVSRALNI